MQSSTFLNTKFIILNENGPCLGTAKRKSAEKWPFQSKSAVQTGEPFSRTASTWLHFYFFNSDFTPLYSIFTPLLLHFTPFLLL